jgi:DNA-binding MarR family transcriptional regulator
MAIDFKLDPQLTGKHEDLTRLLDRVGRMARGLQYSHGLNPAQWDSLRFVARANQPSCTPGGLAAFLGTTKGTASQTLKALEKKGYVRRVANESDKRVRHLAITEAGEALLNEDPLNCLDVAVRGLAPELSESLSSALAQLCGEMQSRCGSTEFGVCTRCGHYEGETTGGSMRCGLKGMELACTDAGKLCVSFKPADGNCGSCGD